MSEAEFMEEAIVQSEIALSQGMLPFGAVLVWDSRVILRAYNCIEVSKGDHADVTGHAEMELIRKMCSEGVAAEDRKRCVLYSSTEPCVMCAGAIFWSGVSKVVYGCSAEKLNTLTSGGFDVNLRELYKASPRLIEVVGPVLEDVAFKVHSKFWSANKVKRGGMQNSELDEVGLERSLRNTTFGYGKAKASNLIPVIDLSKDDKSIEQDIWEAASTLGFFTIINHGIPTEIIDSTFRISQEFFSQDIEAKRKQSPYSKNMNSG